MDYTFGGGEPVDVHFPLLGLEEGPVIRCVSVGIVNDQVFEADETFTVRVGFPPEFRGTNATVIILDDDERKCETQLSSSP